MTWLGREARTASPQGLEATSPQAVEARTRPLRGVLVVTAALVLGAVWWWAALRLVLDPDGSGVVEGTVVAGGWGLSVLPVHCVPWAQAVGARRRARQEAARWRAEAMRWRAAAGRARGRVRGRLRGRDGPSGRSGRLGRVTKAWRRRRSGGGSDPS